MGNKTPPVIGNQPTVSCPTRSRRNKNLTEIEVVTSDAQVTEKKDMQEADGTRKNMLCDDTLANSHITLVSCTL
eukprot:7827805-Ditylum_brightwellii.AAC.1